MKDLAQDGALLALLNHPLVDGFARKVAAYVAEAKPERPHEEPLLSVGQLAAQLGTSVPTVHRRCRDGMPHVRLGDQKRFALPAVLAWLAAQAEAPRSGGVQLKTRGPGVRKAAPR